MRQLSAILVLGYATFAGASTDFNDYEIILSRKPFGATAAIQAGSSASLGTSPTTYRLSALYEGVDGKTTVGLVNKQTNKSLTLRLNEREDDIELVEADIENNTATIVERGQTFVLELTAAPATTPVATVQRPSSTPNSTQNSRFAERRRRLANRFNRQQDNQEQEQPLEGEELQEHLKNYQMEAIRSGAPPLPIPLTEEMDRQLVEEGYLEPQE